MTIKDLAVLVAEPLNRPLDQVFLDQIRDRVRYWRSRLLKNSLDKTPADRKFFIQSVTMKLEEVPASSCGLSLDCNVWRTIDKVPLSLRSNSILFDYVGSVDHGNPFKYVKRWELPFLLTNKYMPLVTSFYAYEDGRIISNVPYITVEGIFDDPEEAMRLNCTTGEGCNTEEIDYPISGDIAQLIVQSILNIDLKPQKPFDEQQIPVS